MQFEIVFIDGFKRALRDAPCEVFDRTFTPNTDGRLLLRDDLNPTNRTRVLGHEKHRFYFCPTHTSNTDALAALGLRSGLLTIQIAIGKGQSVADALHLSTIRDRLERSNIMVEKYMRAAN